MQSRLETIGAVWSLLLQMRAVNARAIVATHPLIILRTKEKIAPKTYNRIHLEHPKLGA
jgi:hypothetical protein